MKTFFMVFFWSTLSFAQMGDVHRVMPTEVEAPAPSPIPTPVPMPVSIPLPPANVMPKVDKALPFHAELKQIDIEGKRAVAETEGDSSNLNVGSQLIAVVDGRDCFFSITAISGKILQLDGFRCSFIDKLKVGQRLEPSLFENEKQSQKEKPSPFYVDPLERKARDDRIRLAIIPYYALGTSLESDNLFYNQPGQNTIYGGGSITTNPAPGVAVEVYETPRNGFGWSTGFSYEFQRGLSGVNAYANGSFIGGSFSNPEASLSILVWYANLIYRLDDFYFPFGLNYSMPSLQGGGNSFGNTTITGNVGLQIGAGYIINDSIAIEFWMENLYLDGTTGTPAGSIDYNGLSFIDPLIRLRLSY